jgi:molybdopterin converting factor small subunit
VNLSEYTTLKIRLFGILREKINSDNLIISIHDTSISLKELRKYLEELYPSLGLNEINSVFAVNKVIRNEDNQDINVKPSDEIAIIPPISGG